ncbi:MAG: restriction endonuclease subunit S [Cyanobacteria bacterium P01_F01_bin.86]
MTLKQTEVGVVPSHWEIIDFRDVCTESAFRPRFSGDLYTLDGNVATLRTTDLDDWGRISYSTMPLARLDEEKFKKHFLNRGDLVITRSGTCGRTAIFEGFHIPVLHGAFSIRFRLSPQADNLFFRYYFNSTGRPRILDLTTGSVQPNLTSTALLNLKIPLPPLNEQKEIAEIINTLDRKIENLRKQNETLEKIAQILFKHWFVDFEFPFDPTAGSGQRFAQGKPSTDGKPYKSSGGAMVPSELGEIPAGWRVVRMEEIANRIAMGPFGSRITTDNFFDSGVPVVKGGNLVNGFNEGNFVYLTEEKADDLKSSNVFPEDIVFTHRGTLGQVGFIPTHSQYPRYVVSQSQMLLSVNKTLASPRLIYRFFRSKLGLNAILANKNTTGVPSIGRPTTTLKSIQMALPEATLMRQFDTLIQATDFKKEANTKQIETLTKTRDALLPKLMSGKLRVGGN